MAPGADQPSRAARFSVTSPDRSPSRVGLWRQVLALGLAVAIAGVAVAGPLRSYVAEQADLARAQQRVEQLQAQKAELQERQRQLTDPDYIRAEARRRLQYVAPGETVYRIIPPAQQASSAQQGSTAVTGGGGAPAGAQPWYRTLWDSLSVDVQPHG